MESYQQRIIQEQKELQEKVTKLSEFIGKSPIFKTLDEKEKHRLVLQYNYMGNYNKILKERIKAFGESV